MPKKNGAPVSGRRNFLKTAGLAGAAAAATIAMPQISRAQTVALKMQTSWPATDIFTEMAQQYVAEYGAKIDGAVLSGSMLIDGLLDLAPLVEAEVAKSGRDAPCTVMAEMMAGGGFTAGLDDVETPFDWLSRDRAEVRAYIDDPLCGFPLTAGAWLDLLKHNRIPRTSTEYARIPRDLPVYVFAGDKDPVNQNLTALHELLRRYTATGMGRVSSRFYPGARHETLNDINREQVTADLVAWLAANV